MRTVLWEAPDGRVWPYLLRDEQPDDYAPHSIPLMGVDISTLDWDRMVIDLHNELVHRGLYCYEDVQRQQSGVTASIEAVIRRQVIGLYREARSKNE